MNPVVTRDQAKAWDAAAPTRFGVSTLELMESAGQGAAEWLLNAAQEGRVDLSHTVIVCGTGNNGGDGWVMARHLISANVRVKLFLVGSTDLSADARVNREQLDEPVVSLTSRNTTEWEIFEATCKRATCLIDALFGIGLNRELSDFYAHTIQQCNQATAVIALDIPSGVDADTGQIGSEAIRAQFTLTFGALKQGLLQWPGRTCAGEVHVLSLGIPTPETRSFQVQPQDCTGWLRPRQEDTYKFREGHLGIVAGGPGKTGAAWLSGHAGLRAGAGVVTIATRYESAALLESKSIETMTLALPREADKAQATAFRFAEKCDALVIGPGLGTDVWAEHVVRHLYRRAAGPLVLDADALTCLAATTRFPLPFSPAGLRVLTPHPGEATRLMGAIHRKHTTSSTDKMASRFIVAHYLAAHFQAYVVLKGAGTIIVSPDGDQRICAEAAPQLATAGSGDVLAGIIGAMLLEATLKPIDAIACACVLHVEAARSATAFDRGLLAHEVADQVPTVMNRYC